MESFSATNASAAKTDAMKIAVIYFFAAGIWIIFSDHLLLTFVTETETLTNLQTFKGWFFVLVTTLLLYLLIYHRLRSIRYQESHLRQTFANMSISTEEALFNGITKNLVENLNVDHALILELTGKGKKKVRALAAHGRSGVLQHHECQWEGGPCEEVIKGWNQIIYTKGVRDRFPDDPLLNELHAESIIGTPMIDASGRMIGLLMIIDSKPLYPLEETKEIISFCAIRAAIELDRLKAWESLKKNEALLSAVFEESIQMMGLTEPDGTLIKVNQKAAKSIKSDINYVLNKPFWETPWWTHSPSLQARLRGGIAEAATGQQIRFESTYLRPDGEVVDIDFSIQPVKNEQGEVTLLVVEGRDITDRKRAETALRESEARFRSVFETTAAGMVIIGHNRKIIDANPAIVNFLGYSQSELSRMTVDDITHPDDRETTVLNYKELFNKKVPCIHYEKRYLRKDGTTVWGYASAACLLGDSPEKGYCVGLVQDISERRRVEEELQQSNRRLKNFADTISHGLRDSLTPIIGFSEYLIENKKNLDDETLSYLQSIVRNGRGMASSMENSLRATNVGQTPLSDEEK